MDYYEIMKSGNITGESYRARRVRLSKRVASLRPLLKDEHRSISVQKHLRAEIERLDKEIELLNKLVEEAHPNVKHTDRPSNLRKTYNWVCKCGAINIYEHTECKMVLIEKQNIRATKPKKEQQKDIAQELNLKQREPITETMPADFFDFLGD